ncbi:NALCN channel auxiliary factor 1 [Trichomycterus rosablanca]|uniref:NALCN channel auxiliary factor 1 n=1 Tax=Trichomycterus rosablanca TaxID=2290929 RepID=UPI002F354AA1
MTSGARKPLYRDYGLTQRLNTAQESEQQLQRQGEGERKRAHRWRLSFAWLILLATLLSDRLHFCAEAKLTGSLQEDAVSPGNSTWRADTCRANGVSRSCFTLSDADLLCAALFTPELNPSDLYLSFCSAYSLMDLLYGSSSPDHLNCSVDALASGDLFHCSLCVQAYQRYDLHAHEKYEEFESMAARYETDEYSVRTCMDECKMVYKPWLCAQYFQSNQSSCSRKIPCEHYCLKVQQRCPFILPDNDDLIHGGTPSFICTGLSESMQNTNQEPQCCDVRWELKFNERSHDAYKRTHPSCQHMSATTSGAPRLSQGRLKLCLLVLVLLQTMATMTAVQNSTCLAAIFTLEDNAPREE